MGADIYLHSEIEKRKGLPYEEKYTDDCYFRDSYNDTSLYWLLGRSWWEDSELVQPGEEYRTEAGELTESGIAKALEMQRAYLDGFRKDAEHFDEKFAAWLANPDKHAKIDDGENSPDAWRKMFRSKLERWIALQERALALGEPLGWSV